MEPREFARGSGGEAASEKLVIATNASDVRLEGLTLSVEDVRRSIDFYSRTLGFAVEIDAAPDFALIRVGGPAGGTIGLLWSERDVPGARTLVADQRAAIHVEFSTDDLDGLYDELQRRGVTFVEPPHDEPWERSMCARDPDGYTVEFAQGRRGR